MLRGCNKIKILFVFCCMVGSVSFPSWAIGGDTFTAFEDESGEIEYKMTGSMIKKGHENLKWILNGHKTKKETILINEIMGITQETNQTTYTDGIWIYNHKHGSPSVIRVENPVLKGLAQRGEKDLQKTGGTLITKMDGRDIGKMTVLGKECVKWLIEKLMSTTCVWRGLPLWTKAGPPGMETIQIATKLTIGNVSEKDVTLPANVKIVEGKDPMEMLRKMQTGEGASSSNRPTVRPRDGGGGGAKSPPPDPMEFLKKLKELQKSMGGQMPQGK